MLSVTRGLLVVLLVAAAHWDVRKRRIPNALNAAVLLCGLAGALVGEGFWAVPSGLAAGLLTVVLCWVPWIAGRIGGGDVKLAGAAAAFVGLRFLCEYLLATALAGGLVAVVCFFLSNRTARKEMVTNLKVAIVGIMPEPSLRGGGRVSVPYGVASTLGALFVIFVRKGW
jgi:prepilin peptidase CpaA